MSAFAWATFVAVLFAASYLALEALVRKLWPEVFISWSRLLAGKGSDPLVGRDLLLGALAGVVIAVISTLAFMAGWLPDDRVQSPWLDALAGGRLALFAFFSNQWLAVYLGLCFCILLACSRLVFRLRASEAIR